MLRLAFVLFLAAAASPVGADPVGIQFEKMPVGCKIHGRYSSGQRVVDIYVGKSGSKHVVKTYEGPQGRTLIRTSTYSRDGLLVRKDWANGKWETYSPAACLPVPGKCSYTYRNADGANLKYRGTNSVSGRTITSTGSFTGQAPFAPVISTIGRFNGQEASTESETSFNVTKYEDCEAKPSS